MMNDAAIPIITSQESPSNIIVLDDMMNDVATPVVTPQESPSNTHVSEAFADMMNIDDMMSDAATPIITTQESSSNTLVLEATKDETQIYETVVDLLLPQEFVDMMNDSATPILTPQESFSSTHVLEAIDETQSHEIAMELPQESDDMMNDAATPILTPQESFSSTHVLEAIDETQSHETALESQLPQESSDDTMNDAATRIITSQEIPMCETMNNSDHKIVLPKRMFEPGTEKGILGRINKHCSLKLVGKVKKVLGSEFRKLEDSFLSPIIKMARREKNVMFSRNLIHQLLLRRIDIGKKDLWFSFGEQPMRFSLREFHLTTGLPCVDEDEKEEETWRTKRNKKDSWMKKNHTVKTLLVLLQKKRNWSDDQRLRLGATILVEGILIANNPMTHIPLKNLLRARNFQEFCKYPWGNLAFDSLRDEVKSISSETLERAQYGISGFIYAIQLWALSSVNQLGTLFGIGDEVEFPLCLHWIETKSPTMEDVARVDSNKKVVVKCIIGAPELHSNLVENADIQFGRVIDLVKRGYCLKRQDWFTGSVDTVVAEAEVEKKKNSIPPIEEKIEFLTKQVSFLEGKVSYLEALLKIQTEKETGKSHETEDVTKANGHNAQIELGDEQVLISYLNGQRQGKKKSVRSPQEPRDGYDKVSRNKEAEDAWKEPLPLNKKK